MAKKKTRKKPAKSIPFELSLDKLRDLVGQLETGNLTLSESLDKYEQGVACLKTCYEALNQAQRRIELLVDLDDEGNLVTAPFDDTASERMTHGTRRSSHHPSSVSQAEEEEDEEMEYDDYGVEDDDQEDMDDPNSLF